MSSSSEGGVVERMRPIDAIPGEALHWLRVAPARFEALNDLAALDRLEIKLIGTDHDESGTTGRTAEIWLKDDEARAVIEVASTALQRSLQNAIRDLEDLGVENVG